MSRLLITLTIPLALAACVADNADSGLVVLRNVMPTTGCVADPTSDVVQSSGIIQANATRGYLLTPLVRNDLVTVEGEALTRKSIFLEGAKITVDFYDKTLFTAAELTMMETDGLTKFIAPTSGVLEPNGSEATYQLEVVPRDLLVAVGTKLAASTAPHPTTLLDLHVQMFGTIGGSSVSSNAFRYPVEVCTDCLVNVVGLCTAVDAGDTFNTGGACNRLQDGLLDCCTQDDGSLLCPPAPPPMN